jgi:acyl carrier protein
MLWSPSICALTTLAAPFRIVGCVNRIQRGIQISRTLLNTSGATNMPATEDKVKQIIMEQLSVEDSEITPSASFVDDLGADSLDRVELIMAFEEAFDLEIPDEQAETIKTVQDAVQYIEKHSKTVKQ